MDHSRPSTFGDLLRRYRLAAGLTQEGLAEKAQVSPRAISDLERGLRNRPWRETVQLLADALRLAPAEGTQLEAAARRASSPAPDGARPGAGQDAATPRNNLPVPVTSFVGRERELVDVARLLAETHLLTLTGSGGCGKTRLALEVARGLLGDYPDGVWLVELAPLADPELVPGVVAAVLGVREVPGQPVLTTLLAALASHRLLLLLDNCEYLIDAGAHLVDALLRRCPHLRVLATSREPLRVAGEAVFRVPSLAAPPDATTLAPEDLAQFAASRLFLERAQAAGSGLALTEANGSAVARICRRLDGIPLALELAAARTRALTVEQIAARLDRRFQLLVGGNRTALPRQQTLAATVGWSYELLTVPERTLFNRLAVFAGGFDLEAAERVGGDAPLAADDVLGLLTGLVEKSLVVAEPGEGGVERYFLLETLRAYGGERLVAAGEADRARDRHRDWYAELAERIAPELHGPSEVAHFERLTAEHDNLRAALAWCGERDAEAGLRLAVTLGHFWESRGNETEGQRWIETMLERAKTDPLSGAKALFRIALWLRDQGGFAMATSRAEESLILARETGSAADVGRALILLGSLLTVQGDYGRAGPLIADGLGLARPVGDDSTTEWGLAQLGDLSRYEGHTAQAQAVFQEILSLGRDLGSGWWIANALRGLGMVAKSSGDAGRAEELLRESVARWRLVGDKPGLGMTLGYLGYLLGTAGSYREAGALLRESVRLLRAVGHLPRLACSLGFLGILAQRCGHDKRGARLVGAAEAANHFLRATLAPDERADLDACLASGRAALGEEAFAAALAEGQAMTLEQAVEYGLEENGA